MNAPSQTIQPLILTFSASDPTAGAGLQADCLAVAANQGHALQVLTGWTAQDTQGVHRFEPFKRDEVSNQLEVLLQDARAPSAVKAGVLGCEHTVEVVASYVHAADVPFVLDPVLASGRGDALAAEKVMQAIKNRLLAAASLITPNWPEAKALTGQEDLKSCAIALLDSGCGAVLIKGEHLPGNAVVNRLYRQDGSIAEFECPRLPGQFHGSGCTLASAAATFLGRGLSLESAVESALAYTHQTLQHAFAVGQGQLIPQRVLPNIWAHSETV